MYTIKLDLKEQPYNIIVGSVTLKLLGKNISKLNIGRDAYVVTNALIKTKYGFILEKALKAEDFSVKFKLIPDTEESKSIKVAASLIQDIAGYDKKRSIFIVAFGGGVIGDLAGFIASIYKRGIAYIQVPTTLLAQVDSSIGGKTAVDLMVGKNLVGAFYQPRLVFSDVGLLKTLNVRQLRSGLAEVIKYGIIKEPKLLIYLEKKYQDIFALKLSCLESIVKQCSHIKADIVEEDEKEKKGIRTILNFGHTIGHAIEAASNYKGYSHGEAVALGMLVSSEISKRVGLIGDETLQRIEHLIKIIGLPIKIKKITVGDIIKMYYHDKKFIGSKNRFVLIKNIGETKIVENIPLKLIKEVLRERT